MAENCASENFYDKKGCRISQEEYENLKDTREYYLIDHDTFDTFSIHTRWIGLDYGDFDDPVIFRTAIITIGGTAICFYYTTEKIARKHHNLFTFLADQQSLDKYLEERLL